jgi:homoserine dehydrogenase
MEGSGAPRTTAHVEAGFASGMHVVTANKGPIAWNWRSVRDAARAAGRRIRFESTVMDGLPVFSLLEFTLPDCTLLGFDAVFNATTNSIVEAMGEGRGFDEALARAQADGYAEADPANDIDGWDAAYKAAALANVAMDAGITPADIERESLRDVPAERIRAVCAAGRRLRLVTSVWRDDAGRVRGRLRATELGIDHPLAPVGAESLGVVLHTDLMGDVVVCERDGLVPQTAYGVYADLLHVCLDPGGRARPRRRRTARRRRHRRGRKPRRHSLPPQAAAKHGPGGARRGRCSWPRSCFSPARPSAAPASGWNTLCGCAARRRCAPPRAGVSPAARGAGSPASPCTARGSCGRAVR